MLSDDPRHAVLLTHPKLDICLHRGYYYSVVAIGVLSATRCEYPNRYGAGFDVHEDDPGVGPTAMSQAEQEALPLQRCCC